MHPGIGVVKDVPRGCGVRKLHSYYLRDTGPAMFCGRLPIPLKQCPCCGAGIVFSRRTMWLNGDEFAKQAPECHSESCFLCPLKPETHLGMVLLQFVGRKFYSVKEFNEEAESINPETDEKLGISRRITSIPRGFKLGETYVFLAHLDAIDNHDGTFTPGVFRVFKPTFIEVIVDGTEPDEVIDGYIKRGLTPVIVEKVQE